MRHIRLTFAFLSALTFASFANLHFASAEKPNIILIISDDQGFPDYGFMNHAVAKTPNIDRIATQGLLYTRGYTMPLCSPSLACLLTGKLPHQNGITGNDLTAAEAPEEKGKGKGNAKANGNRSTRDPLARQLLSNSLILPKALTEAGYLAFQTGKLWNVTYKDVGFTSGMTVNASRHGDQGLTIGRQGMQPIFDFMDTARKEEKPFFVWYAPMMPHSPHTPPAELLAHYQGKGLTTAAEKYYAMVEWFDQTCGELDDYLNKNELADNTVILYLADNGWNANEGLGPTSRAKLTPYELGIRTPMFVRWPAKVKPQRDDRTLASVIDFAPTILKAAGVQGPSDLPGLDLLNREAMLARKSIFVESYTHDIVELGAPTESLVARVIIDGWSKLLIPGTAKDSKRTAAPTAMELFDLQSDPLEKTNLASNRPADVKRLEAIQQSAWKL
jgi:arylsulfatase A-like enzyme